MEGLNQDFPTEALLKQMRLLKGLQQRMARLDTQVEFPILVEYMMDKIPEGKKAWEYMKFFFRIVSLIQNGRLQPIIVIFLPPQF
jgi:hypothetical protein